MVYQLQKNLYDLKWALIQSYKKFDNFMNNNGFLRCQVNHCCYGKRFDNSYITLLLYVDDFFIVKANIHEINELKNNLSKEFAMKDSGVAKHIFGMRITRDMDVFKLLKEDNVKKVFSRFNMAGAKPMSTL